MRLSKFEIRNFKGIEQASFNWEDLITLIGENNCGKSSSLQALQCFLSGSQLKDERFFRNHLVDREHSIELIAHFRDLTAEEQASPAVRGRMHNDFWIIKKQYWAEEVAEGVRDWKEQYYSFSSSERYRGWPDPDTTWAAFPANYSDLIALIPGRGARVNQQSREQLRELIRQQRADLIERGDADWLENPGGGGGWKSNANSILPRLILIEAVHDATAEAISKEVSAYGKILNLIVEKQLLQRAEVQTLKRAIEGVLQLFRPNIENPDAQAAEIRNLERRINARLNDVITGTVSIKTIEPDIRPVLLPSTELVLQDHPDAVKTAVGHQGHGLQRTLIMALLQILAEIQAEPIDGEEQAPVRPVILAVEEPELYMHPQMERKMRDALFRLAAQPNIQVICTTHSPIFLDMGENHKAIVRVVKDNHQNVTFSQVSQDLFNGPTADDKKNRLRLVSTFHAGINEVFFAKRVALLEEQSAVVVLQRVAEITGIFNRHPHIRRDTTIIDTQGKGNIPLLQTVLNYFLIPYIVIHDEDQGNAAETVPNNNIQALLIGNNQRHMVGPTNLEGILGYVVTKNKVFRGLERVEELHRNGALPASVIEAVNWLYFGQATEPV